MIDERDVFEKSFRRYEPEGGSFERLVRRRDRKRRNQRITAGVVGIAAFVAAVWIVTSVASLDRGEKSVVPAGTGPVQTGPAVTGTGASTARTLAVYLPRERLRAVRLKERSWPTSRRCRSVSSTCTPMGE